MLFRILRLPKIEAGDSAAYFFLKRVLPEAEKWEAKSLRFKKIMTKFEIECK